MNSNNAPREDLILQVYEDFIEFVEGTICERMSDNVKNKNRNFFNTYSKVSGERGFLEELSKKYIHRGSYGGKAIETALKKRKKEVLAGELFMLPALSLEGEGKTKIHKIHFFERRNKLKDFGEKVKDWAGDIVGGKLGESNNF